MKKPPMILVADDEPLVADTLVQILREEGYDAMFVSDGAAAVQFAQHARPQVVICDVIMPGLNGIDAAKKIREFLPEAHIILFSGQAAAAGLIERAESEGHRFQVLAKPIKPDVLLRHVEAAIAA
jgi:CheY-like chemotaxis protein